MKFAGLVPNSWDSIASVEHRAPIKQGMLFIEMIPREIRNVISEPLEHIADYRRVINDSCGYKSIDHAIIDSQIIGFRLSGYVKPKNLFFIFGETVEFLQSELNEFLDRFSVPYTPGDYYAPVDKEQCRSYDECEADPRAIVLCKVIDVRLFQQTRRSIKKECGNQAQPKEISWTELQILQKSLKKI
jgi:hypothetical protein